jgi:hypothetical protein
MLRTHKLGNKCPPKSIFFYVIRSDLGQVSVVSIVSRLRDGESNHVSIDFSLSLFRTVSAVRAVSYSVVLRRPGCEAGRSPPISAEVKIEWMLRGVDG